MAVAKGIKEDEETDGEATLQSIQTLQGLQGHQDLQASYDRLLCRRCLLAGKSPELIQCFGTASRQEQEARSDY